jgi:hypothetical protein
MNIFSSNVGSFVIFTPLAIQTSASERKSLPFLLEIENDGRLIGVCSRSDVLKEILNERFVTTGTTRTVTRTIGENA